MQRTEPANFPDESFPSTSRSMPKPLEWNSETDIRPIHTEADFQDALREASAYFDSEPEPGTPDGDRLEVPMTLVQAYEARHFPIDLPDPVEAIEFRMQQAGLTPKDLVPAIGRLNRVHEILAGKRPLTLSMIWRLHEQFGIPAENPTRPPKLAA